MARTKKGTKMRIQISTNVSLETRSQANELIARYGYSLRDVITLGIEMLYQSKKGGAAVKQYTYTFISTADAKKFVRATRRDNYPARQAEKSVTTDAGTYAVIQQRRDVPRAIRTNDPQGI